MASELSRAVSSAVQWGIVGVAIGVLPTYILMEERAKKESASAAAAAASSAAAGVYAAWSATPPPVCPAPPITVATVVAVTQGGTGGGTGSHVPTRVGPQQTGSSDVDDAKMLLPMLNMAQGMMGGDNAGAAGAPDLNEVMKNLPKK